MADFPMSEIVRSCFPGRFHPDRVSDALLELYFLFHELRLGG
jgi:hypothetical protein